MKVKYISKNYKISDKFKDILEKKINKLNKYFPKEVDVKVNCLKFGNDERLELTLVLDNTYIRSEVTSDNMYNNIDVALPKIEKQIIKNVNKNKTKPLKEAFELEYLTEMPLLETSKVVKTKKFELVPLTLEDAKFNLEALGHSFYIFLNAQSGFVNVLYKRNDGNFGVIEVTY